MATPQRAPGPVPKAGPGLVGINLTTAGHLADALDRVAVEVDGQAQEARSAGLEGGQIPIAAARLVLVARWAAHEAAVIRRIIDRLRAVDVTGVARWSGGRSPAFADPVAGYAWGIELVDALLAGRMAEARRLLAGHGRDPVVATVVVAGLGAAGTVDLLRPAVAGWARPGTDADDQRAVVLGVAGLLAGAVRSGTTDLTVGDLADAARRGSVPLRALALLFAGGTRFPSSFVRDAVRTVVAPLNAALRAEPGLGVGPWMIPAADAPLDARVVVLAAAARDHEAAVEAVGAVDLDDLLAGSLGYLDGGVALAGVLLAATTPLTFRGTPMFDPLLTTSPVHPGREGDNARRIIEWIGAHPEVPLAVHAELGHLARPWIGAFRTVGLDRVLRPPVVLDEGPARAYLAYAQARDHVDEHLQDAAWSWAAGELDHLAATGATGPGFDAVGSVLGIVTVTRLDADATRGAAVDRRIGRQDMLWRQVARLGVERLPPPVSGVADPIVSRALDRFLASTDQELTHWRDLRDLAVAHEYLALDHLVANVLWAEDPELIPPPPPVLLVDPGRPRLGLRPPVDLDEAGVAAWTRWRSALAGHGRPARQVAGDQFLAETRD
ncbi:MAG: hypothetical protein ABW279_15085 [Acidimicrobiales bacterium]